MVESQTVLLQKDERKRNAVGNQYRKRHNKLGKNVHSLLCQKSEIECEDKWFSHQPEPVLDNDKCKILWDIGVQREKE